MSLENLDRWITTTPEDRAHPGECNCSACHERHVSGALVKDNACDVDFQCCIDQLEAWVSEGNACPRHPMSYFEPANKALNILAWCEICETAI